MIFVLGELTRVGNNNYRDDKLWGYRPVYGDWKGYRRDDVETNESFGESRESTTVVNTLFVIL